MNPPLELTQEEIDRLSFHPATEVTGPLHDKVRESIRETSIYLAEFVPAGRHRALMLTALQEAMMWGNAAVANGK